jgi:hypothetical protein
MGVRAVGAVVLAGLVSGAAAASPSPVGSSAASADGVRAALTWRVGEDGLARGLRLRITMDGRVIRSGPLPVPGARALQDGPRARVVDLDGQGPPEVVVAVADPGAYCCARSVILGLAGGRVGRVDRLWGGISRAPELVPTGRGLLLVGRDTRFEERWTPNAVSAEPLRVLRSRDGRLVDVTRREPALVAADAGRLSALLRTLPRDTDVRGVVAALTADRLLLGRGAVARRALDRLVASGRVGFGFRADLLRFLARTGYGRS